MVVPPPQKKKRNKVRNCCFLHTTPTIRRSVSVAKEVDLDQANLMTPKTSWNATRDAPRGTPLAPDKRCHEEGEPGKLTPGIVGAGWGMLRNDRMIGVFLRIHEFIILYWFFSMWTVIRLVLLGKGCFHSFFLETMVYPSRWGWDVVGIISCIQSLGSLK